MKKSVSLILVLVLMLGCFASCDLAENFADAVEGKAEATPKVEEMMVAIAEDNMSDAKALLHPQIADDSDDALNRLVEFIDGRKTESIEVTSISINTSAGTGGKSRQEQVSYDVELDDGEVITVSVVYLSDNQGDGFTSFQVVL